MTQVHFDLNRPAPDAPGWGSTTGPLVCTPYSRHVVGTEVIVADALIVELTDGEVTVELVGGWVWRVEERICGGAVRYVLVPESSEIVEYASLVDVDPMTLEPTAEPEPAWNVALDAETVAREAADEDLAEQIAALDAGAVESVNGNAGAITVALVESPTDSGFYELRVS